MTVNHLVPGSSPGFGANADKHKVCRQPSKLCRVGFDSLYPLQFNAGLAQLVEQWFCKPEVGSSSLSTGTNLPSVAQSGSASALGAEGRRFESCHSDQIKKDTLLICDCGEIGRHKRLKISRLRPCRFDSGQSHHTTVAQGIEHLPSKQRVAGSIPAGRARMHRWPSGQRQRSAKPYNHWFESSSMLQKWACSSVGQSRRLIIAWSGVQVPPGPPFLDI